MQRSALVFAFALGTWAAACGSAASPPGEGGAAGNAGAATGGAGGAGGATHTSRFGAACEGDADCAGLTCVPPGEPFIEYGDGPTLAVAHGICTLDCSGDDTVCALLGAGAACEQRVCWPGCVPGPPDLDHPDPLKCQGRSDLACSSSDGPPLCIPSCNSDADCGDLSCFAGGCTSEPIPGEPIGAAVADALECAGGIALEDGNGAAMCTASCTYGVVPSCGWGGTGPADAYCALGEWLGRGFGDRAFCAELCSCTDPCTHPDAVCYQWESYEPVDPGLLDELDHDGLCLLPAWGGGAIALECGG